jgi:hypothetical protein
MDSVASCCRHVVSADSGVSCPNIFSRRELDAELDGHFWAPSQAGDPII